MTAVRRYGGKAVIGLNRASAIAALAAVFLTALPPDRLAAWQCPDGTPAPCRGTRPAPAPLPSVAVMVFESRSRDSGDVYLAEGISDDLTTRLGRLGRLAVRSGSAARSVRASSRTPQAIGRALNATYVVTGSVRRGGSRVRVSVELARAATSERIWGEQFDRSSEDVLRVEDEVAEAIAAAISGRLAPAERAHLSGARTTNPAAYDHYLRGAFQFRKRSPAAMNIAWTEFSAAVALDPSFADAHAQLGAVGDIAGLQGFTVAGMSPDTIFARGERETLIALRLDSSSAQAWANVSTIRAERYPQTFAGVREAADRALALDSLGDQICYVAAQRYLQLGDLPGALRLYRRARDADPFNAITLGGIVLAYRLMGRLPEALAAADTMVALAPGTRSSFAVRAAQRLALGDTVGAQHDLAAGSSLAGSGGLIERISRVWVGDTAGIGRYVDSVRTVFERSLDFLSAGNSLAAALVAIGDRAGALDVLERSRQHGILMGFLLRLPYYSALANEPRFRTLVNEMQPPAASR